jgi:hypothetical protein
MNILFICVVALNPVDVSVLGRLYQLKFVAVSHAGFFTMFGEH